MLKKDLLKLPKIKLALFAFLLLGFSVLNAQNIVVEGTVSDSESNMPLPGVTVLVLGTKIGASTDFDGKYRIEVNSSSSILRFSFMGFRSKDIKVGNRKIINVALSSDVAALDEVVVVGYGSVERRDLTGAVSGIKSDEFKDGNPLSIQGALSGRVSGVQVTQLDNSPGAAVNILIRGGSSLTSGNQPLFVIDGFPIVADDGGLSNPLADINPNQIESVQVLKDASATAVFGAQGANGVIIITTKKGKAGKPRLTVEVNTSISELSGYPDILSPERYLEYQIAVQQKRTYEEGTSVETLEFFQDKDPADGYIWVEEITRQAVTKQFDLGLTGGSETFKYGVAASYLNQEGILKGNTFDRMNFSTNLEQKFNENSRIGMSITASLSENVGSLNDYGVNALFRKALQTNPFLNRDYDLNSADTEAIDYEFNNDNLNTYLEEVDQGYETARLLTNLFYETKLTEGLKFYTSFGLNRSVKDEHLFYPESVSQGFRVGGSARFRKFQSENYVFQSRLNYNKKFNDHRIDVTAVFETRDNNRTSFQSEVQGFDDDSRGIYDLSSAAVALNPSNVYFEDRMISYLGRVNYNYARKYLLTLSMRVDGSSKFGAGNKYGYFPSAALAWTMSDEDFLKDSKTIDQLKLRASFGVTGNNQIPPYSSLARLNSVKFPYGGNTPVTGYEPGAVANPNLKWEETAQYNVGVDLDVLNSRLSLTAEAYYKETTDLLLDVQLPTTSGFNSALANVGSISNKGIELSINSINFQTDNFTWTSNLSISTNRSKILDLGENDELRFSRNFFQRINNEVVVRKGDPIGLFYGYIEDEVMNNQTEIANSPQNVGLENIAGQVKLRDINGDGLVTPDDQVVIGNTAPEFIGGLNNNLNYKNWDLSFFWRWSYGNDVINGNLPYLEQVYGPTSWNTLSSIEANAWSPLNPDGTIHALLPNSYTSFFRSNYVEDGSFLKLDYVTIGYSVPEQILTKLNLNKLRVYSRVTNPLMFTRYRWFDPEVNTGYGTAAQVGPGVDSGAYPRATTFSLGLSIEF